MLAMVGDSLPDLLDRSNAVVLAMQTILCVGVVSLEYVHCFVELSAFHRPDRQQGWLIWIRFLMWFIAVDANLFQCGS